jgi:hypothetical protein
MNISRKNSLNEMISEEAVVVELILKVGPFDIGKGYVFESRHSFGLEGFLDDRHETQ